MLTQKPLSEPFIGFSLVNSLDQTQIHSPCRTVYTKVIEIHIDHLEFLFKLSKIWKYSSGCVIFLYLYLTLTNQTLLHKNFIQLVQSLQTYPSEPGEVRACSVKNYSQTTKLIPVTVGYIFMVECLGNTFFSFRMQHNA